MKEEHLESSKNRWIIWWSIPDWWVKMCWSHDARRQCLTKCQDIIQDMFLHDQQGSGMASVIKHVAESRGRKICLTMHVHASEYSIQSYLGRCTLILEVFSSNNVSFWPRLLLQLRIVISQEKSQLFIEVLLISVFPWTFACVHSSYGLCSGLGMLCLGLV